MRRRGRKRWRRRGRRKKLEEVSGKRRIDWVELMGEERKGEGQGRV